MHQSALRFGKLFFDVYCAGPGAAPVVVDIGSQDINGSLRQVIPAACRYIGVDFVSGKNVDLVLDDPYRLPFDDDSVDVIVSSSCFEHSEMFWLMFLEISRVLKPSGLLYVNALSNGMFHRYPVDCWRFYPDSGHALVSWAHRNGQPMVLLESFIGKHFSNAERWNDFVAVFVKGEQHSARYPRRITECTDQYYNAHVLGRSEILREQLYPEDQLPTQFRDEDSAALRRALAERDGEIARLSSRLNTAQLELSSIQRSPARRMTTPLRTLFGVLQQWKEQLAYGRYKVKREIYRLTGNSLKVAKYNNKLRERRLNISVQNKPPRSYGILATPHTLFVAHAIAAALDRLGMEVQISTETPVGDYPLDMYIVICPQMFDRLPPGERRIIFQMEQSVSSRWFTERYLDTLERSLAVMDYSQANLAFLASKGIAYPHTFHVPVGGIVNYLPYPQQPGDHGPGLQDESCEVLFYGDAKNERRQRLLKAIQAKFRTRILSNAFGAELHRAIRGAKVVVNLHYYEGALLETTRIYECLSLGVPVVSETSSDIADHDVLEGVVHFVDIDDEQGLIGALTRVLSQPPPDFSGVLLQTQKRFRFMLLRCLLALKHIAYEQFCEQTADFPLESDAYCLSLPETVERRRFFQQNRPPGLQLQLFDGIRFTPGQIGCALSYKYLCQKTLAARRSRLLVCEDDVALPENFHQRYRSVEAYLGERHGRWDIFCGMMTRLHPHAQILAVEKRHGEIFVTLDRVISMVFNIYTIRAIQRISVWSRDDDDTDINNNIDRFLERSTDLRTVITIPFLVGHREDVDSSIWGGNNQQLYIAMIANTEALLQKKADEFLASLEPATHA